MTRGRHCRRTTAAIVDLRSDRVDSISELTVCVQLGLSVSDNRGDDGNNPKLSFQVAHNPLYGVQKDCMSKNVNKTTDFV